MTWNKIFKYYDSLNEKFKRKFIEETRVFRRENIIRDSKNTNSIQKNNNQNIQSVTSPNYITIEPNTETDIDYLEPKIPKFSQSGYLEPQINNKIKNSTNNNYQTEYLKPTNILATQNKSNNKLAESNKLDTSFEKVN